LQQIAPREFLESRRIQVRDQFAESGDGWGAARALTSLADETILLLVKRVLGRRSPEEAKLIEPHLALVAIGGYARSELAPYSDIDLLLLHSEKPPEAVAGIIGELVREIWDIGLALGHNVGSPKQLAMLASKEVLPATSFLDSRLIYGPDKIYQSFSQKIQSLFAKPSKGLELFQKVVDAVQTDQERFGGTGHLLEPNVKRTAGGLRDIHLIRWSSQAVHQTVDLATLEERGILGMGDAQTLSQAHAFLMRLRCNLHFQAHRAHDDLLRSDQIRIAKEWNYPDLPGRTPVEVFMAEFFRHSTAVADIRERFIERTRPRTLMTNARELFLSRRVSEGVSVGPDRLVLTSRKRREVVESLEQILSLAEIAASKGVRFDYQLTEALRRRHGLRRGVETEGVAEPLSAEEARLFLQCLEKPGTQHQILSVLHRVGVLSRVIPAFEHARHLLQFNAYHKYTVDDHTFVVLEHLESFEHRDDIVGRAYRGVVRKDLLHLAALLHDLGKGYEEDHSEIGRRIADEMAARLYLSPDETQTLVFLVHRHLMMSDLALKRDTSDPKVWITLGKSVGEVQLLKMLYALTCADIMGVGPGVFTPWTADLLEDLYRNTLAVLGDEEDASDKRELCEQKRAEVTGKLQPDPKASAFVAKLPLSYLSEIPSEEICAHLALAAKLAPGEVDVHSKYRPDTKTTTYTVITHEQATTFPFSKICGGLAAHHLDVLRARIYTLDEGTIIDQFDVRDTHYFGDPTKDRVQKVESTLRRILKGDLSVQDALYSTRSSMFGAKPRVMQAVTTRVTIDNSCSETCTVIDVFTNNRRGLLYTLAQGIAKLGLSVEYAKIATFEDEAADIFYVQEQNGEKVSHSARLDAIEASLDADVKRLVEDPRSMGF
jgi:[protein-PII] uridylyltransferase